MAIYTAVVLVAANSLLLYFNFLIWDEWLDLSDLIRHSSGMSSLPPFFVTTSLFFFGCATALGQTNPIVKNLTQQNSSLSNQRISHTTWNADKNTSFTGKSFPMTSWSKHFSSMGSKRAPIDVTDTSSRKRFKTETKEFPIKKFDMAAWNDKLSGLYKEAQISTDDRSRKIADQKLYGMMLQDTRQFADMAEELSLRDLNKYQFRRNRSSGELPVSKVGD